MNIFFVLYCLSQACLGEINSNFRRIYIVFEDTDAVKLYFYLENYTEADNQNIYHEIMSMFEYYLDGDELYENIKISSEVIYGNDKNDIPTEKNFIEFYRKQVDLENAH